MSPAAFGRSAPTSEDVAPASAPLEPFRSPDGSDVAPVPPWAVVRAVVRPERLVMSLLAPFAAAPTWLGVMPVRLAPLPFGASGT